MKNLIGRKMPLALALFALILISKPALASDTPPSGPVDGALAARIIEDFGDRLLIIDVRNPEEFAQGHIPRAINIPVSEFPARMEEIPVDRPVLLLCLAGKRSTLAFDTLMAQNRPIPKESGVWRVADIPEYHPDGSYSFRKPE